eukprot:GDKK01000784.1.p1 GENE.GDKK01000784.1~~GDKK01000784.1.p1  ORF type:complete len:218 (+),score=19.12 GDKK01000784.1:1-654(+)
MGAERGNLPVPKPDRFGDRVSRQTAQGGLGELPLAFPDGAEKLNADLIRTFMGGKDSVTAVAGTSNNSSKFAIVMINNIQYKVSVGDVIAAQRMPAAVGSKIAIKKVLMVGGQRFTAIGRPLLSDCRIVAEVEEHKRMKGILGYTEYKGRHLNKFTYNEHAVTMLRIVELAYNPKVVGEVDRGTGILLPEDQRPKDLEAPMPGCYYADELPKKAPKS